MKTCTLALEMQWYTINFSSGVAAHISIKSIIHKIKRKKKIQIEKQICKTKTKKNTKQKTMS